MDKLNYTTINHNARLKLKISVLEYCLADMIYNLSNNPDSKIPNWCYASKDTLGKYLGVSKQSVHKIINKLIKIGVLERDEKLKYLKTNGAWYSTVLIDSKESLPMVNNVYPDSKESLLDTVKKVYTTRIIDNTVTNVTDRKSKKTSNCPLNSSNGHYKELKEKYPNGHTECSEYFADVQKEIGHKFINSGKQFRFIHQILRAGFTFTSMDWAIDRLKKEKFTQENGWDFATIAGYLDRKAHGKQI